MGTLSLVATPIGNLDDITIRALKVLFHSDVIACEDTRRTGMLLQLFEKRYHDLIFPNGEVYKRPDLLSYYDQNELIRIPEIISLLKADKKVVLVSDAGTPAVSDPGFKLVRECIKENIPIEALPGASSVLAALVVSGLPTNNFIFLGYPPQKSGHRKTFFEKIRQAECVMPSTFLFFESPYKLIRTLEDMQNVLGNRDIVICRELTKMFESKRREKIASALLHYKKTPPKGEYVILFSTPQNAE